MTYGKIENNEVIYFTDNYIIREIEIVTKHPITKEETVRTQTVKTYHPNEELMLEQGWYPVEYINEVGENVVEDNKLKVYIGRELTPAEVKKEVLGNISAFDTSSAVNGFYYGDRELWIDKATRVGLVNAVNAAIALGEENITFGIQGISVTLPCQQALQMLYALEKYALACYNVTLQHQNTVDALEAIEDLRAYDYTTGYPEKLHFEV